MYYPNSFFTNLTFIFIFCNFEIQILLSCHVGLVVLGFFDLEFLFIYIFIYILTIDV